MVSLFEQETVINYQRDDSSATIWTSDSTTMTKLDRLCNESPEFYSLDKVEKDRDGNVVGKFYKLTDKKMISFRGKKATRVLTEEQKAAMRERLSQARNKGDSSSKGIEPANVNSSVDTFIV